MPRDPELDRLKTVQDLAFQRKQSAWQTQQQAWEQRKAARERMNAAFERKQRAFDAQKASGEAYYATKTAHRSRIDALKAQQERAFRDMGRAFDDSKAAYRAHDGAAAQRYSEQGKAFRAESQSCTQERRGLEQQIRDAWARHEPNQRAFQDAKTAYTAARADFDVAKAAHERASADFNAAREAHERAKQEFQSRLEAVRAQRQTDNRSIAERAGVPFGYRDDVRVSTQADGSVNIYFGGVGAPDGSGHGHYSMDRTGHVTYRRDPFDPHGAHNFTDAQRDYDQVVTTMASGEGEFGFRCRFRGYDAYVESNTNQQGRAKIDIYYGPDGPFGPGHHHAVAYRESPHEFVSDLLR